VLRRPYETIRVSSLSIYDLAIIGGGPAGMAAAAVARAEGLAVCLLDEQPRFGGQLYRQPPREFRVASWLPGAIYRKGKALIARVEGLAGLDHIAPATVWACFKVCGDGKRVIGHDLLFHDDETIGRVRARRVLIACGCYEAPVPFPGWQLSGVMSAGAIQTLLKSQRVAAGRSIVLAGTHPLLFVVAEQLLSAGIPPAALVVAQRAAAAWRLARAPRTALTGARQLGATLGTLIRLRRARVPVLFGHGVVEALGKDQLESVRVRELGGAGNGLLIPCDALGVCYGFLPSSELARQAGAKHVWAREGGWVIECDDYMRSSVPGLSVAGEITGVAGGEAAALSGEIAALGVARDSGRMSVEAAERRRLPLQRRWRRLRRFAAVLAELSTPSPEFIAATSERSALLCRCEDVTVGQLEDAVRADPGVASASTAKLLTRVGMGYCQGRMCEINVRRVVARERKINLSEVAGFVVRPPVKPVPLAALAAYPQALEIDPCDLGDLPQP
jgi:D-hydroxyproline dehydrogenase subunit alpha